MPDYRGIETREYPLAAGPRRFSLGNAIFVWTVTGITLVGAALTDVPHTMAPEVMVLYSLLAAGYLLYTYHWRLRIDGRGVHRRRFIVWTTWPWEDFETGKIHKFCGALVYLHEDGKHPTKVLHLGALGDKNAEEAMEICRRHWNRPPDPGPPAELSIRYAATIFGFPKRTLVLNRDGLTELSRKSVNRYPWDMIQEIDIRRYHYDDEDFRRLTIQLPENKIVLRGLWHEGEYKTSWSRAKAAELVALIRAFVPSERITEWSERGRPRDLRDAESRLAFMHQSIETDKRQVPVCFGVIFLVIVVCYLLWSWFVIFPVIITVILLFEFFLIVRKRNREIRRLERYREAAPADQDSGRACIGNHDPDGLP